MRVLIDDRAIALLRACDAQLSCVQQALGVIDTKPSTAQDIKHPILFNETSACIPNQKRHETHSLPLKFVAVHITIDKSGSDLIERISLGISTLFEDEANRTPYSKCMRLSSLKEDRDAGGIFKLETLAEQVVEAINDELKQEIRQKIERACTNEKTVEEWKNGVLQTRSISGDVVIVTHSKRKLLRDLKDLNFFTPPECADCPNRVTTRHCHEWDSYSAITGIVDVQDLACANRLRHQIAANRSTIPRNPTWKLSASLDENPFLDNMRYIPTFLELAQGQRIPGPSYARGYLRLMAKIAIKDASIQRTSLSTLEKNEIGKWCAFKPAKEPCKDWGSPDGNLPTGVRTAGTNYLTAGRSFKNKLIEAARRCCTFSEWATSKFTERRYVKWDYKRHGPGKVLQVIIAPPENYTALATMISDKAPESVTECMVAELLKEIGGRQYSDEYHCSLSQIIGEKSLRHMDFTHVLLGVSKILVPLVIARDGSAARRLLKIYRSMRNSGSLSTL